MKRCQWVNEGNPLYVKYHDEEWGRPSRDDAYLFEMLLLECFVAGLSWECVLNKREAFRAAFAGFDAQRVAGFGADEMKRLMLNPGIIRHRGKIQAAISNARVFLAIQREFGSFADYAWGFTGGKVIHEPWHQRTTSPVSDALSRDLKRRGMRFVGSVTIYSWMQAVGIICAHGQECARNNGLCTSQAE
ncbi:MAG: DNA-3-methyladenine glycosylase I [Akkermansia sp.]|nr:DNA-3-methyladenine glycosylase I [Akkermansia sp.]